MNDGRRLIKLRYFCEGKINRVRSGLLSLYLIVLIVLLCRYFGLVGFVGFIICNVVLLILWGLSSRKFCFVKYFKLIRFLLFVAGGVSFFHLICILWYFIEKKFEG